MKVSLKRARKAGEDMSAFCVVAILDEVELVPRVKLYGWYQELNVTVRLSGKTCDNYRSGRRLTKPI